MVARLPLFQYLGDLYLTDARRRLDIGVLRNTSATKPTVQNWCRSTSLDDFASSERLRGCCIHRQRKAGEEFNVFKQIVQVQKKVSPLEQEDQLWHFK